MAQNIPSVPPVIDTSNVALSEDIAVVTGGYEYTAGFSDRSDGTAGTLLGTNVAYTQEQADTGTWLRFGLDATKQAENDAPYWTDPEPSSAQGLGLFGGAYMPPGFTKMFDFTENSTYNAAVQTGDFRYTAATGRLDFSQAKVGDLAACRFDFNIVPQVANTTIEVGLIWATRAANGNITFTFPLTAQPIFYGTGTVGKAFLNRVPITAYFASNEDVRAFALPAIKADNPVLVQPLAILSTIRR